MMPPVRGADAAAPRSTGHLVPPEMKHPLARLVVLAALLAPSTALAQLPDRVLVEPHVGLFFDSYDISADGNRLGAMGGFRVSYALASRTRLAGHFTLAQGQDVALTPPAADFYVYDNNWLMATGGAEYDLTPGRTRLSLGLQAGLAWRQVAIDRRQGTPPPELDLSDDGYSTLDVVKPGVYLRHPLGARTLLVLGVEDHIFDLVELSPDHSFGFSLGVSFR